MNRKMVLAIVSSSLMLLPAVSMAQIRIQAKAQVAGLPSAPSGPMGIWVNPSGTVRVETGMCGGNLCGKIIWASALALADARASGITQLVDTQLLRDYRKTGQGRYQGTVFVPDMGRSFHSTITQKNPDSIRISGCILGGLICKSQDWHRA